MTKINCIDTLTPITWFLIKEGLFPSSKYTHLQLTKLLINFLFYLSIVSILLLDIINTIKARNMEMFNKITCITIPILNLAAKSLAILYNKESFLSLISDLKSVTFNTHNEAQNNYIQIVDKLIKSLLKFLFGVVGIYIATTILLAVAKTTMMIPAPIEMGKYNLLYKCLHFLITLYLGCNSVSFDVLFVTLLSLCIAQLNILEQKLMNAHVEINISADSEYSKQLAENEIVKHCVILHEMINRFVEKLNRVLSFPLFVQYIFGCFIICSTIFQITMLGQTDTFTVLSTGTYIIVIFGQLALYHWLGNEIMCKSSGIPTACYLSKWYNLHRSSHKTLMLIMERAKRPIYIQLYKYIPISLETLGVIVRWSYSLFALIKARYN